MPTTPPHSPPAEHLQAGRAALAQGNWEEARRCFEAASPERDSPEALEGLGMACWWLEEYATAIDARECAYRLYRTRKDVLGTARMAIWLGHDYAEYRGETAVANGWLRRAERFLEGLPLSSEHALLAYLNAHNALMGQRDPVAARRHSVEAAEIARKVGPTDIEMIGVALEGLAMVTEGEVAQGMSRLDEATAAALAGELNDPIMVGTACCYLIRACELVHDYDRAAQWCERVREFSRRWNLSGLFSACRIQYAGLLTIRGKWTEAEQEIEALRRHVEQVQPRLVPIAQIRMADLRRRQGRWDEAEELLARSGAHLLAVLGRAQLAYDRDELASAAELAEEYLRRVPTTDRTERVPGLDVLARASTAAGSLEQARAAIAELQTIAQTVGTEPLRAIAAHAEGCLLAAEGDHHGARGRLEESAALFERNESPFEAARARLHLAKSLIELGSREPAAVVLQAARKTFEQLSATRHAAAAADLDERLTEVKSSVAPGSKPEPQRSPAILFQIQDALADRYSIKREIGKGGMATVYLARDLRHDRFVALKVMRPDLASSVGTERFLQEIRITAQLRHPRILPVFDSGQAAGQLWYTMPYVEGETLRQRLLRERTLAVDEALRITCEVATALDYAHRQGIVHRDVKPENIMIEHDHAVIADFGVARALDAAAGEGLTATGFAVGTPAYMSPEEASGSQQVDGRADVYALGCILYEMLAGGPPFTGTPKAVIAQRLHGTPVPVTRRRTGVPRPVTRTIERAMATQPEQRFQSAREFANTIEHSLQTGTRLKLPLWRPDARSLVTLGLAVLLAVVSYAGWRAGWFSALTSAATATDAGLGEALSIDQQRNPQAYEAYLRGQEIMRQGASGPAELRRAIAEFEQAVKEDPRFAAAWAQLGWAKAALWNNAVADPDLLEQAKAHGERALRLGGAEAEARQVLAYYHIMKGNRGAAREESRRGLEADPTNARLVGYTASLLELEGRWREALRYRERAVELDPTAAGHAAGLATNLLWLRRYPEARVAADRFLILGPTNPEAYQLRAMVALGEGKLEEARKFIRAGESQIAADQLLPFVATYWDLYWLLDSDQQSRVLGMGPEKFYGDSAWWHVASSGILMLRGDTAAARTRARSALPLSLAKVRETPEDAYAHSRLALVHAFLGRREDALRAAEKSISVLPIARDAQNGAVQVYRLACVQARLGLESEALATLETLLSLPFYVSPAWLKLDANFARLRGSPGFTRLTNQTAAR